MKEGYGIGRILMNYQQLKEDFVLSIPGLEIYPNRRKIYRGRKEISLTVSGPDILVLGGAFGVHR